MRLAEGKTSSTAMEVRTEVRTGYLKVILGGEFQVEEALTIGKRIFEVCHLGKLVKVLLDARGVTGRLSLLDKIDLADSMAETQTEYIVNGDHRLWIAHVVSEGMSEAPRFAETLAANRGAKILVTTSMDEALRWLGVDQESSL